MEEVDGEGQEGTGGRRKGEASQRGAPMDMTVDDKVFAQDLNQMRCEMTSPGVEECALRARSTHGVHHAIVEVNIVIGVVLGEVLVATPVIGFVLHVRFHFVMMLASPGSHSTCSLIALGSNCTPFVKLLFPVVVHFGTIIPHDFSCMVEIYSLQLTSKCRAKK